MPAWRFREYVTDEVPPRCPILEWFGILDEDVQPAFELLVKELSETEDWDEPRVSRRKYKELSREHAGLCQLMFKVGRRQFRPLGLRNLEEREFLLLCGCEKAGRGRTIPDGAFIEALRLKVAQEAGRGTKRDYTI